MHCGATLGVEFELDLNDALRVGAIVRGMEIDEADVLEAEELQDYVRRKILKSGDEKLIYIVKQLPEESRASTSDSSGYRPRSISFAFRFII